MHKFIDKIPDWFLLIVAAILGFVAFVCYTPTCYAQEVRKVNKTTVVVTSSPKPIAKQDTVKTDYKVIIDNVVYPVYLNPTSGTMFIVRISQRTGKPYRCYTIKGKKIKDLFNERI